jgi:hypothetical protein
MKHQNINRVIKLLFREEKIIFLFLILNRKRIKTAASKAITPPSLLGTARKIAYANKKYHSGWICLGVTKIFAGMKFSASIKTYPNMHENKIKVSNINKK